MSCSGTRKQNIIRVEYFSKIQQNCLTVVNFPCGKYRKIVFYYFFIYRLVCLRVMCVIISCCVPASTPRWPRTPTRSWRRMPLLLRPPPLPRRRQWSRRPRSNPLWRRCRCGVFYALLSWVHPTPQNMAKLVDPFISRHKHIENRIRVGVSA